MTITPPPARSLHPRQRCESGRSATYSPDPVSPIMDQGSISGSPAVAIYLRANSDLSRLGAPILMSRTSRARSEGFREVIRHVSQPIRPLHRHRIREPL